MIKRSCIGAALISHTMFIVILNYGLFSHLITSIGGILGLTDLPEIMHDVQFLTYNSKSLSLAGHHTQDLQRLFVFIMLRCLSRAKHITLARND